MKSCPSLFFPALLATLFLTAQRALSEPEMTPDEARATVTLSLRLAARQDGFTYLSKHPQEAIPIFPVLAHTIAIAPGSEDAMNSAGVLCMGGEPALPFITRLIDQQRSFPCAYALAHSYMGRSPTAQADALSEAFYPMLHKLDGEKIFGTIYVLHSFNLSAAAANRAARRPLEEGYFATKLASALYLAPMTDDPEILGLIRKVDFATARYIAARIEEEHRLAALHRPRMPEPEVLPPPRPPTEAELAAREKNRLIHQEAQAKIEALARVAIPEIVQHLKPYEDEFYEFLWLDLAKYVRKDADLPLEEVIAILDVRLMPRPERSNSVVMRDMLDFRDLLRLELDAAKKK
jgi:hypothetical protein